jgi:hypothetical protein
LTALSQCNKESIVIFNGNQGQTGKQTGQTIPASFGEFGDALVTELQPHYYENTYRGQKFSACNTAAVTVGALTATNVSFALYNPPGSGKNLAIVNAGFGISSTTFATGALFLAYNTQSTTPVGTTALTIKNNLLTGATAPSVALAYSAATLSGTPTPVCPVFSFATSATVGSPAQTLNWDVAGQVLVAPGGVLSVQGSVAALAVGFIGLTWDEIAI